MSSESVSFIFLPFDLFARESKNPVQGAPNETDGFGEETGAKRRIENDFALAPRRCPCGKARKFEEERRMK